eukprot:CAMPEP_0197430830 /NCGR_PEP_ID=MMETSP1170-20131217/52866_1 /TAXON_ID=54406 /ORGANISM="Sarcinochrysis sp, Strain CCMP770" /LENGTH=152 /DNA_ID=CAMNT_0042958759 /DNA_START=276 /DNA_END=731 /DNA_ORIENTATION=-
MSQIRTTRAVAAAVTDARSSLLDGMVPPCQPGASDKTRGLRSARPGPPFDDEFFVVGLQAASTGSSVGEEVTETDDPCRRSSGHRRTIVAVGWDGASVPAGSLINAKLVHPENAAIANSLGDREFDRLHPCAFGECVDADGRGGRKLDRRQR